MKFESADEYYIQVASFNAKAGDPENPKGTRWSLTSEDGYLIIAEAGLYRKVAEKNAKFALGAWTYTKEFDRLDGNGTAASSGAYLLIDQPLNENLSVFLRHGHATTLVNSYAANTSFGILQRKFLSENDNDSLGLAATKVTAGDECLALQTEPTARDEYIYELTYRKEILEGIFLQPDYQFVVNPLLAPQVSYAHLGMLRLELNF